MSKSASWQSASAVDPAVESEGASTPAEIDALAAYDEQLRQGISIVAAGSEQGGSPSLTPGLAHCLQRLAACWPRKSSSAVPEPLPNFVGRFEIQRVLGQGGFGIVYLAQDPLLRRKVALKVPRLHVLASEALRERFRREGRVTAALDHPNIVPIYELGESPSICYIAFSYCEGPNLAEWLRSQTSPVVPRIAAELVKQLAEAMHYSHSQGVLHRDLKPNNVLLFPATSKDPSFESLGFVPRIVDFGLARLAAEDLEATGTSAIVGTPLYMAPEQSEEHPDEVGPATDVYALGVILYELLSGSPPFHGVSPLAVLDQVRGAEPAPLRDLPARSSARLRVPRDLETICLHCLQKRPEDRYASARELAHDLERFLAGTEIRAQPTTWGRRLLRIAQHPLRVREAGLTVIGTHAAVIGSMLLTLYMVHAGEVIHRPAGFDLVKWAPIAGLFMLTGHAPMLYLGWQILHQRLWAAWASLLIGGLMVVASLCFMTGVLPAGMTEWDRIPGFRMVYPLMGVLFLFQTIMSTCAVLALRKGKKA
jgi:tRNA A-37 threonylcarbamoyl transferase component Bud32